MSVSAPPTPPTKHILGIDLGTTNSCVAIPCDGQGPGAVVVVTDEYDRPTVPSVVYKEVSGNFLVGHKAKQKMGTTPPPVAFIKRFMGKDHRVSLRDESMSPEQVSAVILKHLKELAQGKLGGEIKQAVITIPARFDLAGQQATVEAARMAGLEVLTTMPEPVAAALAYGLQDDQDALRIFCFDLGGGTFDATVLTKNAETGIRVLAFDGDEYLGGYNFDTEFAKWILARLVEKGYSLDLDWDDPRDQVVFQKLMRIAEKAKIALSDQPEYTISEREVFEDHDDTTVDIEITVSREQYVELIRPMLETTIEISARAIATAQAEEPGEINRVIMVGGSSRIPILKPMLEQRLGCTPLLVDPDKIVARGAAVKAGSMIGSRVAGIDFLTPIPTRCTLDSFDIVGRVTLPEAANLPVFIAREDGGYESETVTDVQGKFTFAAVELMEGETNGFDLRAGDKRAPLVRHAFEVRQDIETPDVALVGATNFITNEVGLMLSDGPYPLFKEGEEIPREKMTQIVTVHDGQSYARFDVYHGNHMLGEVVVNNLPPGLPKQSPILVNVRIDGNLAISGNATLIRTGQGADFLFRIEKPKLPTAEEMRQRLDKIAANFEVAVSVVTNDAVRLNQYGEWKRRQRELDNVLGAKPFDQPRAARLLEELSLFAANVSRIEMLHPAWSVFAGSLASARQMAAQAEKDREKARRADFTTRLDGLEAFATQAYQDKNKEVWDHANEQLKKIVGEIKSLTHGPGPDLPPDEYARQFKRYLAGRLQEAQETVRSDPRFAVHEPELSQLIRDVNAMNPTQPSACFESGQKINARIDELIRNLIFRDGETGSTGG